MATRYTSAKNNGHSRSGSGSLKLDPNLIGAMPLARRPGYGDYAWAMQDALMIAYVRDGRTIQRHLNGAALNEARLRNLQVRDCPAPMQTRAPRSKAEKLHSSRHGRDFYWPDGRRASEINLYHSWFEC